MERSNRLNVAKQRCYLILHTCTSLQSVALSRATSRTDRVKKRSHGEDEAVDENVQKPRIQLLTGNNLLQHLHPLLGSRPALAVSGMHRSQCDAYRALSSLVTITGSWEPGTRMTTLSELLVSVSATASVIISRMSLPAHSCIHTRLRICETLDLK